MLKTLQMAKCLMVAILLASISPMCQAEDGCPDCIAGLISESVAEYRKSVPAAPIASRAPQESRSVCPDCGQEDCWRVTGAAPMQYVTQESSRESKAIRREQRREKAREEIADFGLILFLVQFFLGCGR